MEEKQAIADLRDVLQYVVEDGYCSPRATIGLQCVADLDDEGVGPIAREIAVRVIEAKDPNADHSDLIADVSPVIRRLDEVIDGVIVER